VSQVSNILSVFDMKALRNLRSLTIFFSIGSGTQTAASDTIQLVKYVLNRLGLEENSSSGLTTFTVPKSYLNLRMVTICPRLSRFLGSFQFNDRAYGLIDKFASSLEFKSGSNNLRGGLSPSPFSQNVPCFQLCLPIFQDHDRSQSLPNGTDPFQAAMHAWISLFPLAHEKGILQFVKEEECDETLDPFQGE
jgi:hypothetical protein